ncbi:MAG: HupE/UreJ family protein [Myxococcota bacterium]
MLPTRSASRRLGGIVAGALLASTALGAATAHAHMGSTKAVVATIDDAGVDLSVGVEALDAGIALGLGTQIDATELVTHEALIQRWLGGGLAVTGQSGPCTAAAHRPTLSTRDGKDNVSVALRYDCPQPMGAVTLSDNTVFDDDPDHEVFVSVQGPGGDQAHVLRAESRSVTLSPTPETSATAAAFLVEGGIHLVTGYDHLLFLLSLILAAGLIAPRDGLRAALRDVAWVVTAFTVGHSISLVAATLGYVSLPSRWVEAAIAASIVLVAGMNVTRPKASVARPWLAGAFGLIHGFGFSSVLADVGLPMSQRFVALLSFNVGIELAQLAVVAAVLVPLSLAARHKRYRLVVMQGGSLAIATFGCIWLVERVWG